MRFVSFPVMVGNFTSKSDFSTPAANAYSYAGGMKDQHVELAARGGAFSAEPLSSYAMRATTPTAT